MTVLNRESVKGTLDNLIEQFSDVYCFYREVIQNSLDAGTGRVDVWLEFIPDSKGSYNGVMIIHIDDYGEGMNKNIIDHQLTRLFSSSKENDLTKIGKFGIGFVSVFAIKPDAVNIDTSRDGQDWRVLFDAGKDFERFRRDYPVDGTKVQLIKTCNRKFFNHFKEKSRETVVFWCKHSEAEIYFQDEMINQPFDVDSICKIHVDEPAGEVVAGYTSVSPAFFGFYNQGLTLVEGAKDFFPGVSFKIKSKYLEHTLTRDNIREDENYWKAMDLLNDIVKKRLPVKMFSMIEEELLRQDGETALYKTLLEYAASYILRKERMPGGCREKKIALDIRGNYVTVGELFNMIRGDEVLYDFRPNNVTRAFVERNRRVLRTGEHSALLRFMERLKKDEKKPMLVRASEKYFIPQLVDFKDMEKKQKALLTAVEGINKKMSRKTESIRFADFDYEDSCIKGEVCVVQEEPGELTHVRELTGGKNLFKSVFSVFSKRKSLVLNTKHPYIQHLLQLTETDREMAAYFLSKLLYMDDGIDTETDSKLVEASLERRGE